MLKFSRSSLGVMAGSNNANKEIFRSKDIINNAEELDARPVTLEAQ
jgi:hypothetical protein